MSSDLNELRCNNLRCRKLLGEEGRAVVTTCSHCFCVSCAERLFGTGKQCPACQTLLSEPDDVVICSLNPSNDYKTSVLSGLAPPLVMEIATRAMSFWQYQIAQEQAFQALYLRKTQDHNSTLERQLQMATSELSALKNKIHGLERDVEAEKRKSRELAEATRVKEREYGKLRAQYDKLKRKTLLLPGPDAGANIILGDVAPMSSDSRHGSVRPSAGPDVGAAFIGDRSTPLKQPTVHQPWPPLHSPTPPHSRTVSTSSSAFAGGATAGSGIRPFHPPEDGVRGGQQGYAPVPTGGRSGVGRMSSVTTDGGGWPQQNTGGTLGRGGGQQRRFGHK